MKIEELRPMQGYYNPDIIPAILVLQALYESPTNTMPISEINKILTLFKKDFKKDFHFLETYGVVNVFDMQDEPTEVTLPRKEYDETYDLNLLENCKVILRDLEEPVTLYELAKLFIMRYPVEDFPYIIDLLQFENVIGDVVV